MTDMESLLNSSLSNELVRFLRNPVIKLKMMPSEEVAALQLQIQDLQQQLEAEQKRYKALEVRYGREVGLNCQYEDLFRIHGIRFRK